MYCLVLKYNCSPMRLFDYKVSQTYFQSSSFFHSTKTCFNFPGTFCAHTLPTSDKPFLQTSEHLNVIMLAYNHAQLCTITLITDRKNTQLELASRQRHPCQKVQHLIKIHQKYQLGKLLHLSGKLHSSHICRMDGSGDLIHGFPRRLANRVEKDLNG